MDNAPDTERRDRTLWRADRRIPVREFLSTETASSGVLFLGIVVAIVWYNISQSSYDRVWATEAAIRVGSHGLTFSLRDWVNQGLMALFFLVVGLEARREFDLGDLRDHRSIRLPFIAGLVGMAIPAAIYIAVIHGGHGARGWGTAMSSDTALALGALALLGKTVPPQVRLFLLTVFVVDDIAALLVIAIFYGEKFHPWYAVVAIALLAVYLAARWRGLTRGPVFAVIAIAAWVAMVKSGIDPVVVGLLIGLSAPAYTPVRDVLDSAVGIVRGFREQPTAGLARRAIVKLAATQSPNDRLRQLYHPWSSFVIVPLFALANIGVSFHPSALARAYQEPITLAIIVAYLIGKPLAIGVSSAAMTFVTRGRDRPPVGWLSVLGGGTVAGVGFTVSVLVATRVFEGQSLQDAKLGSLTAAAGATVLTTIIFRAAQLLPVRQRTAALLGTHQPLVDLTDPVDDERDHIRGPFDAPVTLVEYGDFECPYCGRAEPVVRSVLASHASEVRYVWRHLPLVDVHPHASSAAEAAEAAGAQGAFWQMHDLLLEPDADLTDAGLLAAAESLDLDVEQFANALAAGAYERRIARDVESADLSGVSGTPTFFVNGQRHHGAYDAEALTAAVESAHLQASL